MKIPPLGSVVKMSELAALARALRRAGKTISWTNGCFDLLHSGHLLSLEFAARQADVLVVGVNSDASVRGLKGPGRPLNPARERARLVAALRCVGYAVIFSGKRAHAPLRRLRPDVFAKGGDYTLENMDQTERRIVEDGGGRVIFSGTLKGFSTTALIRKGGGSGRGCP